MDTYLAIASKRDWRNFRSDRFRTTSSEGSSTRAASPGARATSSPRFVVVASHDARERVAETVYAPSNVRGAALVVALVGPGGEMAAFDAGRTVQNMFLAAWNEGVASVPNGIPDPASTARALGLSGDERPRIVLAFGYPARPRDVEARAVAEWSADASRKPLDDVVEQR